MQRNRKLALHRILFIAFFSCQAIARFTLDTCWGKDCVLSTTQNTFCFFPDRQSGLQTLPIICTGTQADLASVLNVHLQQDLSIAYYNGVDNSRLGGVDFTVPGDTSIIRLCVSGQAADMTYSTLCVNAAGNNVLQGSPFCKVRVVPMVVSDGCYNITSSATSTSSSTSTSTNKSLAKKENIAGKVGGILFGIFISLLVISVIASKCC